MAIFLNKLGIGYINVADISFKQNETIQVSSDVPNFNALYTALFWFYLDYGILGIVVFPLLFGLLLRGSILLMLRHFNFANIILVFCIFHKIMHFVFDYSFITFHDLLFLLALYILGNYSKNLVKSF